MLGVIHLNATAHPAAAWTLQQLREAIPSDHKFRFLIHARDSIFAADLDASLARLGLKLIRTPVRSPQTNALCQRLVGTVRRECLDWIIPLSQAQLKQTLSDWKSHYNRGRPHSALSPSIPEPPSGLPATLQLHRHRFDRPTSVLSRPILNGLHHEYVITARAA
jgi:transposase InsO family protein